LKKSDYQEDNGIFLLSIEDFCRLFRSLDVCKIHKKYKYTQITVEQHSKEKYNQLFLDMVILKGGRFGTIAFISINNMS